MIIEWLEDKANSCRSQPSPTGEETVIPCSEEEVFQTFLKISQILNKLPQSNKMANNLPTDEQVNKWLNEAGTLRGACRLAYAAGADERQEAIIHWLITGPYGASIAAGHERLIGDLRDAMKPKPPSAEEVIGDFDALMSVLDGEGSYTKCAGKVRQALERLAELEGDR